MLKIGEKEFRNLEEQVQKNLEDILALKSGIKIEKSITLAQLPTYTVEGCLGQYFLVTDDEKKYLYLITLNGSDVVIAENLGEYPARGPQGIQGVKGDKGDPGESIRGPQGIQGVQGVRGRPGEGWAALDEIDATPYTPTFTEQASDIKVETSAALKIYAGTPEEESKVIGLKFEVPKGIKNLKDASIAGFINNGSLSQTNLNYNQIILDLRGRMVAYVSLIGAGINNPSNSQILKLEESDKTDPYIAAILGIYEFWEYEILFLGRTGDIVPGVLNSTAIDNLIKNLLSNNYGIIEGDNFDNIFKAEADGTIALGFKNIVYSPVAAVMGVNLTAFGSGVFAAGIAKKFSVNNFNSASDKANARKVLANLAKAGIITDKIETQFLNGEADDYIYSFGIAIGDNSITFGGSVYNDRSVAMGLNAVNGANAFASGNQNVVKGDSGAAFGFLNYIAGFGATAFGEKNTITGGDSFISGYSNIVAGNNSFVAGESLKANYNNSFRFGKFNEDNSNNLLELGNGISENNRHNAFSITREGYIKVPNFISTGATTPSGYKTFKCVNGVLTAID